jgi:hypothetical protein
MQVLKKIINKHMSFSLGTLVALVMMTGITACEGCDTKPNTNGTPSIAFKGKHETKHEIKGETKDVEISISVGESEGARYADWKLKVKLTKGNGKLIYKTYDQNKNKTQATIDATKEKVETLDHFIDGVSEGILEGNSKNIVFTFSPEGDNEMEATFVLVDANDNDNEVGSPLTATWKAAVPVKNVDLTFAKPADNAIFTGSGNKLGVEIEKDGDATNTDDILVKFTTTSNKATFKLGKVDVTNGEELTLTSILGLGKPEDKDLKAGKIVITEFDIVNIADGGEDIADIILEVKCGALVKTKKITWIKNNIQLTFNHPADDKQFITGTTKYTYELAYTGEEISTEDLLVKLNSSDADVSFTLVAENQTATSVTAVPATGIKLSELLGVKQISDAINSVNRLDLALKAANNKLEAEVELVIEYKGKVITSSPKLTWKDKNVVATFNLPADDKQFITGTTKYTYELAYTGEEISTEDLLVKLNSSDGDVSFTLVPENATATSANAVPATGIKLSELLGVKQISDAINSVNRLDLALKAANNKLEAEVELVIEYKGKVITSSPKLTWKDKNVVATFNLPADDKQFITGTTKYTYELAYTGEEISTEDLLVKLNSSDGDVSFTLVPENATATSANAVPATGIKLSELLGVKQISDAINSVNRLDLALKAANNKLEAEVELVIEYKGKVIISSPKLTWKETDVAFKINEPVDGSVFIGNNAEKVQIANDTPSSGTTVKYSELTVKVESSDEDVTFALAAKPAAGAAGSNKTVVDGTGVTLNTLFGDNKFQPHGGLRNIFLMLNTANNAKTTANVIIKIEYKGKVIAKRNLVWKES